MGSNNIVCRNFDYNEKAGGILELISLNCDKCEFNNNCDIKTTYQNAFVLYREAADEGLCESCANSDEYFE